jgi:hypothetical protein
MHVRAKQRHHEVLRLGRHLLRHGRNRITPEPGQL